MPKLVGRAPEHKYSTRSLDVQLILIQALKSFRNEANKDIVDKELGLLEEKVVERKARLLKQLTALGIDVPETWL
jgi:hypothetical protein